MHEFETKTEASRALTVVPVLPRPSVTVRRDAAFLAHLIATRVKAPQTCLRRRVEPTEAVAAYRTIARLV